MGDPGEGGRWYPTAVTLSDGGVLVASGADQKKNLNIKLQILSNGVWSVIGEFKDIPLYPWLHLAHDGRVFMSGWSKTRQTQLLNTSTRQWSGVTGGTFQGPDREYGSSVMYDVGKVVIIGGGISPQKTAEMIDLTQPTTGWQPAGEMSIGRRHHNATILPDGTVLVTGGTSGTGGPMNGFNDVTKPVKRAELWDPVTRTFKLLSTEQAPRLYHCTAVLLPDGWVLSAGGGEYRPDGTNENSPNESRRDAHIFSPPYLFRGSRPDITSAPNNVTYGQAFELGTSNPGQVGAVNFLRLSSVTHAFNQNQRINFLTFAVNGGNLRVTAPPNANVCPPGHYMVFVLNNAKIPSAAKIIRIN
ncbi:MAG: galactose oxidase early set domain-containing protein [Verrucomicrobiota bacterium]|nr:galactose oxidase early set domain-containing protein [Verrucomicrobiota bacterium]